MNRRMLTFTTGMILLANASATVRAAEPRSTEEVRFEQRIGERLPLETEWLDTKGQRHQLRDYFRGQPAVLYFGYARCPQLCSIVADGTVAALRQIRAEVGHDYSVVAISIDPTETAAESRQRESDAIHRYGRPGDTTSGWHFLTGTEASIQSLAAAAGFHFEYDSRSRQYAHPSGFLVATPNGRISRYFLGVDFAATDVARALTRAGKGQTGSPVFELVLLCFRGEGLSGRYGALIWRVLGGAVALTILSLVGGIGWMLRDERRTLRRKREATP